MCLMKIYFAGSIRGGRKDVKLYLKIIQHLKKYGEILTEHVGDKNLNIHGEHHLTDKEIHDRDLSWLKECKVVIAEVTTTSLGVGYEIAKAIEWNKKILCLYRQKKGEKLSAMIAGAPKVVNKQYKTIKEAKKIIDSFLKN